MGIGGGKAGDSPQSEGGGGRGWAPHSQNCPSWSRTLARLGDCRFIELSRVGLQKTGIRTIFRLRKELIDLSKELGYTPWIAFKHGHLAQFTPALLLAFRHR